MGKSKAQRKQEKKVSMQEVKKEQEVKKQEKKQVEEVKKEPSQTAKTPERKPVGPEQVNLTLYTVIAMVVTFISAGVTAVAMVVYAKPVIYILETTVGSTFNDYSLEAVEQLMYEDNPDLPIYGLYLGIAALVAVGAVVTLLAMIRAVNEFNKPNIALTIASISDNTNK